MSAGNARLPETIEVPLPLWFDSPVNIRLFCYLPGQGIWSIRQETIGPPLLRSSPRDLRYLEGESQLSDPDLQDDFPDEVPSE